MITSHTPAPWFYDFAGDTAAVIVDSEGYHVIDLVASSHTTAQSALAANARLIAAAPEMLALLREVVDARNANTRALKEAIQKASPGWIRDARAAIARATQE